MSVILKCKMCGGDLVLTEGSTIATCEYCGTVQTVPSADNEKKLTLFERANRHRADCEFDKAAGVYESIVADFPEEAEAYWGLILCKFGIEYVDDPKTGKKIPTCHRSSYDSIMDDPDLDKVLDNADSAARKLYQEEARQIEKLRKDILEVSGKEDPYDIFICYKETDKDGNRTVDSVLAQDLYTALTDKGYRVFFSRITLEDKLGQAYEPYIFAALNSAKVMLAVGTDYENYNAVWVRNEWSRFLKLTDGTQKKVLIPCYKDIDAYDMPKEFRHLQAQDLGKVGAIQDLLRGIEKLITVNSSAKAEPVVQSEDVNRMFLYNTAVEKGKENSVASVKDAIEKLRSLGNWNGADLLLPDLEAKLIVLKKKNSIIRFAAIGVFALILLLACLSPVIKQRSHKKIMYDYGVQLQEKYLYAGAYSWFEQLGGFKDSEDRCALMEKKMVELNTAVGKLIGEEPKAGHYQIEIYIPELSARCVLNYDKGGDCSIGSSWSSDNTDTAALEAILPFGPEALLSYDGDTQEYLLLTLENGVYLRGKMREDRSLVFVSEEGNRYTFEIIEVSIG